MDENTKYEAIMDKLNEICQHGEESDRKLDTIVRDYSLPDQTITRRLNYGESDVDNLKTSMDFISEATENLQRDIGHKVDMELFDRVRDTYNKKIDDLINHSKRNNLSSIYRTRSGLMLIIFDQPLFQLITLLLCGRNPLFKVETYCSRTGAYCYGVKTYYNQQ